MSWKLLTTQLANHFQRSCLVTTSNHVTSPADSQIGKKPKPHPQACVRTSQIHWRDDHSVSWLERHLEMTQGFIVIGKNPGAWGSTCFATEALTKTWLWKASKWPKDLGDEKSFLYPVKNLLCCREGSKAFKSPICQHLGDLGVLWLHGARCFRSPRAPECEPYPENIRSLDMIMIMDSSFQYWSPRHCSIPIFSA